MLFPLVTYPYVTRVLLAENLGKVDFAISFISYFLLVAALGINTYATREGAGLRNNQRELNEFSSQVFTINMVSTAIAYALLLLFVLFWPHLQGYLSLIAIQSVTIIGTTMGVEWVYSLEEDYGYITARTVLVQVIAAALMFLLVRKPSDYAIYAAIMALSTVGGNVFNWFRARRYTKIRLVWNFDYKRHLVPMLILFGNAIAVTIYVNIDISLLSVMRGDYEVGLYGVAVKVYRMVKQLLVAVITVSLPRLSLYAAQHDDSSYHALLKNVAHGLLVIVAPALTLLFLMATDVVLIVGGEPYLGSVPALRVLCAAGLFAIAGNYVVNGILLPFGNERYALKSTVLGAVVNLVLNFAFIPLMGMVGAAITTVLAEACVVTSAAWYARHTVDFTSLAKDLLPALLTACTGIVFMTFAFMGLQLLTLPWIVEFFLTGMVLVMVYVALLFVRKDSLALQAVGTLFDKLRKVDDASV